MQQERRPIGRRSGYTPHLAARSPQCHQDSTWTQPLRWSEKSLMSNSRVSRMRGKHFREWSVHAFTMHRGMREAARRAEIWVLPQGAYMGCRSGYWLLPHPRSRKKLHTCFFLPNLCCLNIPHVPSIYLLSIHAFSRFDGSWRWLSVC